MASPIDKYLQEKFGKKEPTSPIDQYINSLPQRVQEMEPEEGPSFIDRFIEGVKKTGRAAETLSRLPGFGGPVDPRVFTPRTEEQALSALAGAGAIEGGALRPAEGLLTLPGLFTEKPLITDLAADFVERASNGLYTRQEIAAKNAGLSDEEIGVAYGVGDFVGMTAPMGASVKVAGILLRSPTKLTTHIAAGSPVTDFVAGAVYGGLFGKGDTLAERGKDILKESAAFGVGRVILDGLIFSLKGFRLRRSVEANLQERLLERVKQMENGETPVLAADEAEALMQLLSEESFVASSPAAHEILAKSADQRALVAAVMDLQKINGSGGSISLNQPDFTKVSSLIDDFRKTFPGLRFDAVKQGKGSYNIVFGTKGLSNKQRAQLKAEGKFEGQSIYSSKGVEYFYLGKGKKGRVKVKTADGKTVSLKEEGITVLPKFRETFDFGPAEDALYRDFRAWFEEKGLQMQDAGGGMSTFDLIKGVREGKISLDEGAKRSFDVGGALVYSEEAGLFSGLTRDQLLIIQMFEEAASTGDRAGLLSVAGMAREFASREGINLPGNTTGEILVSAERLIRKWQGAVPEELVSKDGTEMVGLLGPPPAISFDRVFQSWAKERGIPLDAPDAPALVSFFGTKLREDIWRLVPEEDRVVFDAIREEFHRLVEEGDIPLEALGNVKGLHLEKLPNGVIQARDVLSGLRFRFGSERAARQAIAKVMRPEEDMIGSLLSPGPMGIGQYGPGLQKATDMWNFGDNVASRDFLDGIPSRLARNVRDWLLGIERDSGIPLFTQGFDKLDTSVSRMRARLLPFAREIERVWKGVSKEEKLQIVEFWRSVEYTSATIKEIPQLAKEFGLSTRQTQALIRSRALFDEGARIIGLSKSEYVPNYYSRMQPYFEKNGHFDPARVWPEGEIPAEINYWWEMARTGEMATIELDPEIVMHKYFRSIFFKQEVAPYWENVAKLVEIRGPRSVRPALRIRDLPLEQQQRIMARAMPGTTPDSPVLPQEVQNVIKEYLTIIRGAPASGVRTAQRFNRKLFDLLKIEGDDRILEEFANISISTMYGAAMGARMALVARNSTQMMWNQYTRNGNRYIGKGLENALTQEGYREALESGAIRSISAGVPFGDIIHQSIIENAPRGVGGPWSKAVAGSIRAALKAGNVSRKLSEQMLIPYSASEDILRAWSYHEQKLTTGRALDFFEEGKWDWSKAMEEGMAFFAKPIRDEFTRIFNALGRDEALRYAGKMAADEAHFIYGVGAQPAWMQSVPGRFIGMFGTWPLWALELYGRRAFNGTPKQIAKFWARTLALVGAFSNMAIQSGIDLWSWISPASTLSWSGGPAVDYAISLKRFIESPLAEKPAAFGRMVKQIGRLSLPGQSFYRDVETILDQDNPRDAFIIGMMGRPTPKSHYAFDVLYNPDEPLSPTLSPEAESMIQIPWDEEFPFPALKGGIVPVEGPAIGGTQGASGSVTVRGPTSSPPGQSLLPALGGPDGS